LKIRRAKGNGRGGETFGVQTGLAVGPSRLRVEKHDADYQKVDYFSRKL